MNWLFAHSQWPARLHCGIWDTPTYLLVIWSQAMIWLSYWLIPISMSFYILKQAKKTMPKFRGLVWHFAAFILFCGMTHLDEIIVFYWPGYRFFGVIDAITAILSATCFLRIVYNRRYLLSLMTIPQSDVEKIALILEKSGEFL